jgi:monothiol glutaredoxin
MRLLEVCRGCTHNSGYFTNLQIGLKNYFSFNILSNPVVREQLKVYSKWPTFPQLYVKGKLVGGCDIVREMQADGSLQKLLKDSGLI